MLPLQCVDGANFIGQSFLDIAGAGVLSKSNSCFHTNCSPIFRSALGSEVAESKHGFDGAYCLWKALHLLRAVCSEKKPRLVGVTGLFCVLLHELLLDSPA